MDSQAMIDVRVISAQIGRCPRGTFHVAVRCCHGYPQVIRVHPVLQGKPFPTLYWLTCPFLTAEISKLEAQGACKLLERSMQRDPQLRSAMQQAHERYAIERAALLSQQEVARMQEDGTLFSMQRRGIGGIADRDHLKCLHLHAAHALADFNPIGDEVLRQVGQRSCAFDEKICSAY